MTSFYVVLLIFAGLGLGTLVFIWLWSRVSKELRAMEPRETIAEHKRRSWR